jgi:hypothetical protein
MNSPFRRHYLSEVTAPGNYSLFELFILRLEPSFLLIGIVLEKYYESINGYGCKLRPLSSLSMTFFLPCRASPTSFKASLLKALTAARFASSCGVENSSSV